MAQGLQWVDGRTTNGNNNDNSDNEVHALLRPPQGSNKRSIVEVGGKQEGPIKVRRERSQPYSTNMSRNCFTSSAVRAKKR